LAIGITRRALRFIVEFEGSKRIPVEFFEKGTDRQTLTGLANSSSSMGMNIRFP
jgi:hypothetical protein